MGNDVVFNKDSNDAINLNVEWPPATIAELITMTVISVFIWQFFYVRRLMPAIHNWAVRQPFYSSLAHRSGHLAGNGQDDITLMFVLAVHHIIAGTLTVLSSIYRKPFLFRMGAMLEFGFEVADTSAMMSGHWPHVREKESPLMKFALFAHHLPGLFLMFPVLLTAAYESPDIRLVGSWLLFAGGVSALAGGIVHTRNFDNPKEMKQAAFVQVLGGAFFIYARFVVFPRELLILVQQLETNYSDTLLPTMTKVMGLAMMTFNTIVLRTNLGKTVRYVRKALGAQNINLNDAPHKLD
jgi:hypothetical protein